MAALRRKLLNTCNLALIPIWIYNFKEITAETFIRKTDNIFSYSDITMQLMIAYVVLTGIMLVYFDYNQKYKGGVHLFNNTYIYHSLAFVWMFWNHDAVSHFNMLMRSNYFLVAFVCSFITFRQWFNFRQIQRLQHMFKAPSETETRNSFPIKDTESLPFLFLLITFNVIINVYVRTYQASFDADFDVVFFITRLLMPSTLILKFIWGDNKGKRQLKFDFFGLESEFIYWNIVQTVFMAVEIVWCLLGKYYLHPYVIDVFYCLFVFSVIYCGSVYPGFREQCKQKLFEQKISDTGSIIINNNHCSHWSQYIGTNINNYYTFLEFVADSYCVEDMLFIFDVIKFKNKLITILTELQDKTQEEDDGFILPFYDNDHLPTSPIVNQLDIVYDVELGESMDLNQDRVINVAIEGVYDLYNRYINPIEGQLNVPFISEKQAIKITRNLSKLSEQIENGNIDDNNSNNDVIIKGLLTIFDNAAIETSNLLQFMYREFVINKLS